MQRQVYRNCAATTTGYESPDVPDAIFGPTNFGGCVVIAIGVTKKWDSHGTSPCSVSKSDIERSSYRVLWTQGLLPVLQRDRCVD